MRGLNSPSQSPHHHRIGPFNGIERGIATPEQARQYNADGVAFVQAEIRCDREQRDGARSC